MFHLAHVTEPFAVIDTFASEVHSIEDIGGECFRITYCANMISPHDGSRERVVVARIVLPKTAIPPAIFKAASLFGLSVFGEAGMLPREEPVH